MTDRWKLYVHEFSTMTQGQTDSPSVASIIRLTWIVP